MDFRTIVVVLGLVSVVAGDAHAQLAPGDTCILKKAIKVTTKPKGKGKTVPLDAGTELLLEEVRGKFMKLIAKGTTVWLRRGKLKNMCGGAEVVDDPVFDPVFEPEAALAEEPIEATEVAPETETIDLAADSEEDGLSFEEAEPSEPEDGTHSAATGASWGSDVDLGALAGLGVGAQGGNTRLTFDVVVDCGWRLLDSVSLGARLFLHGTPGVGYGFGGLTAELRYFLPRLGSIEPYAQAGIGGGYGAAGTKTAVFVARLVGGGRMAVWDRLFVSGELVVIISQLSVAGQLDLGLGWSF